MKYFFIVGERSGDQHASKLIFEIKQRDKSAVICGWGGSKMQNAGAEILTTYHDISFMGFWEVVKSFHTIKQKLKCCQRDIKNFAPDVLVLVDFPGFNLRMAKYAKSLGIKTCYYISPKIWAWKESRINTIKAYIDKMLVILPFEEQYYKKFNFEATYVGNPSLEEVQSYIYDQKLISTLKMEGKNIAFLPGSRVVEIKSAINVILKLSNTYDDYRLLVAAVSNVDRSLYEPLEGIGNISVLFDKTYEILEASEAAVVTSGTASLEVALLDIPQVVVYRTSSLSYAVAKLLVKVKYISLVNLIADRKIVTELIQGDYDPVDIATELEYLLNEDSTKKRISEGYSEIRDLLGKELASRNAAEAIVTLGSP